MDNKDFYCSVKEQGYKQCTKQCNKCKKVDPSTSTTEPGMIPKYCEVKEVKNDPPRYI